MSDAVGLAIECSGARVAVALFEQDGEVVVSRDRPSELEHARRLLPLIEESLAAHSIGVADLFGIAIDVGPGSFTALRIGLATARGLAQPHGTRIAGVTSFAALTDGLAAPKRLVVPLVVAARAQLYAGFHRGDADGRLTLLRGPAVGTLDTLAPAVEEALALCAKGTRPLFVGPGAQRERDALEARWPASTKDPGHGDDGANGEVAGADGPSVAAVARIGARLLFGASAGNAAGTHATSESTLRPLYVRPPQAVERAPAARPLWSELEVGPLLPEQLDEILPIEQAVFTDPWPRRFFLEELAAPESVACVVRHRGMVAGYLLAWRLESELHLGNLAVAPAYQRRGVGRFLVEWLLERAREGGQSRITLEVRASNFAAQELYRNAGFRAVALRRGYYQDTGEDALIMLRDLP
jgi:ribosomal-protein-alanine N-acetyltransferase